MAPTISSSDTVMVGSASGNGGIEESGCGGGCFNFKASRVASLLSAIVSSVQARRTAPLKSPSSSLEDTRDGTRRSVRGEGINFLPQLSVHS